VASGRCPTIQPVITERRRVVHGDDLLYDFFQHLLAEDADLYAGVPEMLIESMGVWFPLETYAAWPVLLPYALRDPECRGSKAHGRPDAWASPSPDGYLRDDNSLVKGLPRALRITGPRHRRLTNARLGTEFVAAHVWRHVLGTDTLASRIPELNSFIPNLVWLPGQIAKLTDREGGPVQRAAQAIATAVYREAPVDAHLRAIVEENWARLPQQLPSMPVSVVEMNWFVPTQRFYDTRQVRLEQVLDALRTVRRGDALTTKVVASRYTEGLPRIPRDVIDRLIESLTRFADPAREALPVATPGSSAGSSSPPEPTARP
jgi:hypothetical protein